MKLARSTYYYRSRGPTATKNAVEKRIALLCAECSALWLPADHRATPNRGNECKPQSGGAGHAGKRALGASAARAYHQQRTRQPDLPEPRARVYFHRCGPALGGRYHLHRDRSQLRLLCDNPRCVVAPGRGLRTGSSDRYAADVGGTASRNQRTPPCTRPDSSF